MANYELADFEIENINHNEIIADSFVYKSQKYIVIKPESLEEFLDPTTLNTPKQKPILLGAIFAEEGFDKILPLTEKEYIETLNYYLTLKLAFAKDEK